MFGLRIENLKVNYGEVQALKGISLEVNPGEMFFVLGPSGCGKSTLLKALAGLVPIETGRLFIAETDITELPAYMRNTGMVFQNYALFPHLSVEENIAYGLRLRGVPKEERKVKAAQVLNLVGLTGLDRRMPAELSGGQQQRVALARAVVIEPQLLLLDEPLSNLDAGLRMRMRRELKALQRRLAITTVYVTHDQREALSLADRVAILNDGHIEQVANPYDVYYRPINRFVASFVGEVNFVPGRVKTVDGTRVVFDTALGEMAVETEGVLRQGQQMDLAFRPEDVNVRGRGGEKLKVVYTGFEGTHEEVVFEAGDGVSVKAYVPADPERRFAAGDEVGIDVRLERVRVFPKA